MMRKIKNLHVEGFRGLSSLSIRELSAVNLFVGKNNSGKTTLLEALRLLLTQDARTRIYEILTSREEFSFRRIEGSQGSSIDREPPLAFEALFHGRPAMESLPRFSLRSTRTPYAIDVQFVWV